ncbi:MAG: hypothetical protein E4G74_04295, partial [Erysipelotrichales bacterium]
GTAYPKSYGLSAGAYYPNDIKGIAYLRAMRNTDIVPLLFQYAHAASQGVGSSEDAMDLSLYYPFLRWKLLTQDHESLAKLYAINEGVEHLLIKNAGTSDTWETFIHRCSIRPYTRARIQRVCAHLMVHTQKTEIESLPATMPLRILGFNAAGRDYLKILKARKIRIASRFNQIPRVIRELEFRATVAYATPLKSKERDALVAREMAGPVILTPKDEYEKR